MTILHRKHGETTPQTIVAKDSAGIIVDISAYQAVRLAIAETAGATPVVQKETTPASPDAELTVSGTAGEVTWRPIVSQSLLVTAGRWSYQVWVKLGGVWHPIKDGEKDWFLLEVGGTSVAPS